MSYDRGTGCLRSLSRHTGSESDMTTPDSSYRDKRKNHNCPIELPIDEVRSLYESGMSMKQIGEHFSVNAIVVHKNMKRHNVPVRTRGGRVFGAAHHAWKGDNATYNSMHERLVTRYGRPQKCEVCGTTDPSRRYDWANLTGNYRYVEDYKRMCRSCHRKFDRARRASGDNIHGGSQYPVPKPPESRQQ